MTYDECNAINRVRVFTVKAAAQTQTISSRFIIVEATELVGLSS